MKTTERKSNDKRKLIMERTYALFQQYGIVRVTMDLIATECSISKKTIYGFFNSKDDLLHHVIEYKNQLLKDEFVNYPNKYPNALLSLQAFLNSYYYIITSTSLNFLSEIKRFHHTTYQSMIKSNEKMMKAFIEINIQQGKAEGVYLRSLDENDLSVSYNSLFINLLSRDFYTNTEKNNHPITYLNQLFVYRLLSDQGHLALGINQ